MIQSKKIQSVISMCAFSILLGIAMSVLDAGVLDNHYLLFGIALLPLLPLSIAIKAFIGVVQSMDELQKKIQFESILSSALIISATAVVLGLLEVCELIPHIPVLWVPALMFSVWGCASLVVTRKYR
jgi:hypothetical protein